MNEADDVVVNEGDGFRTVRHTLGAGERLLEALRARGVTTVYKGDQNELWDGALANGTLAAALAGSELDLHLFVHDEKMGTGDLRIASLFQEQGDRYVLSEDYFGRNSGAVWVHQDISFGPFFMEVVSPADFERAAVNMRRSAELWAMFRDTVCAEPELQEALLALGVALELKDQDTATRMGPAVNREIMERYFARAVTAQFFYLFSKSIGYYGLAPVYTENISLSSVRVNEEAMLRYLRWLLVQVAVQGALRLTPERDERRAIVQRARQIADRVAGWLKQNPDAAIADLEVMLGEWLVNDVMVDAMAGDRQWQGLQAQPIGDLERSSQMYYLRPDDLPSLLQPVETRFFFFDLALRYPEAFAESYNEALNHVGLGLQRIKYDPDEPYTPPFFVEMRQDGVLRRYNIQLMNGKNGETTITLSDVTSIDQISGKGPVRSAYDFMALLFKDRCCEDGVAVLGKAAPFAAEMRRLPNALAMPRQGSKYSPMIDHLMAGLRRWGVPDVPDGLVVRIANNAMASLGMLGERGLRLPPYLAMLWGEREITAGAMAESWRAIVGEARRLRDVLAGCEYWQHVHLVKLLAANSLGRDVEALVAGDERLRTLVEKVAGLAPDGQEARRLLLGMGRHLPEVAGRYIEAQLAQREALLARRAELQAERPPDLEQERLLVEFRLLLVWAAYVRLLVQQCEALPYLNDRPYIFAFYLTFGKDIMPAFFANAQFDLEYARDGGD